jgi:hypothetical protein
MIPQDLLAILERVVRVAVIVWGGLLLGGALYLLTR